MPREPQQDVREHRVAGRERVVVELLRPRDQLLAVGGREEEAAALLVGEELDREPREPVRLPQPAQLARRDVQLEQPVGDVRVVVEVARRRWCGPRESCAAAGRPLPRAGRGGTRPAGAPPRSSPAGRAAARPPRAPRARARSTMRSPCRRAAASAAAPGSRAAATRVALVDIAADDRAAVLERLEQLGGSAFLLGPGERQPLDAVGVGVLRRGEPALGQQQLAQHVLDRLARDLAIAVRAGDQPAVQVRRGSSALS